MEKRSLRDVKLSYVDLTLPLITVVRTPAKQLDVFAHYLDGTEDQDDCFWLRLYKFLLVK